MVPRVGLEPTWPWSHQILSLACLPIPSSGHILYPQNYFMVIFMYFTTKNRQNATIIKSIILASTLPYKIHLKDKSSNFSIFNFLSNGANIAGVIKSSTSDLVTSATLVARIKPMVTPITLYVSKKVINSEIILISN